MKIPRIEPQANKLSTEAASNRINRDEYSDAGQRISTMGRALADAGAQIEKVGSLQEKLSAENHLSIRLADIEKRAAEDTDTSPTRQSFYEQEIEKARREAASKISIPLNRSMWEKEAEIHTHMAGLKVKDYQRRRMVDNTRAEFVTFSEESKNKFIQTGDPREREMIVAFRDAKLKEMVDAGIMSAEGAAETKVQQDKIWRTEQVKYDLQNDLAFTVEELRKGDEGMYKAVEENTRSSFLASGEQALEAQNKQIEAASTARTKDLQTSRLSDWIDNPLSYTEQDVKNDLAVKVITPEFARDMIGRIRRGLPKKETNPEVYASLWRDVTDTALKPSFVRDRITKALADGDITRAEHDRLLFSRQGANKAAFETYYQQEMNGELSENASPENKPNKIKLVWEYVQGSAKRLAATFDAVNDIQLGIMGRVIDRLMGGEDVEKAPQIAVEEVKSYVKEKNPELVALDDIPHSIADAGGVKSVFMGDTQLKGQGKYKGELSAKTEYVVGDYVWFPGSADFPEGQYRVDGFDTDGEPRLSRVD